MRVRAAVARSSTWRASASQTQNAVAYDISGACAAVGDLGAEAIAGHARQPGPSGRGGYEELPGREPPATNGRNQVAKIPDGRRASDGMRDGAAVPGPATMDPVLLGGAGGAIRTSGWSDSHQWVERFAPVGGAHGLTMATLGRSGIRVICRLSPPSPGRTPGSSSLTSVWHTLCRLLGVF
jgi:hypothetical protein